MVSIELVESIDKFSIFHDRILDIYRSNLNSVEKWKEIAEYMNSNYLIATKVYRLMKKSNLEVEVRLDYEQDHELLIKRIKEEPDPSIKLGYLVLSIHFIIYDLVDKQGNYLFSLNGREEMAILKKDLTYYINLASKIEQNIFFHSFIILFGLESLFTNDFYVGIDYEFTNKKIQLAQLNFEHSFSLKSIIWIVGPPELDAAQMKTFVDMIITNSSIKKILHGSDSLDIPYMYNHMLEGNPKKIIKFTKSMIDTRFLCEYYKLSRDEESDNKCSIYDEDPARSAIYYFGVISEEQQKKLSDVLESMPPHQDNIWVLKKLLESQILYAQYDVLFLKYFYYRIINVASKDAVDNMGKKVIIDLYKHVLYELIQFVYLERNDITFLLAKCKEEVDVVNNYFIRTSGQILKMIDIFNKISVDLVSSDPKVEINKIIKVNHFKVPVLTIIKRLVYGFISTSCKVQQNKNTIWREKLDNQFIFDFLAEMKFDYLLKMFKNLATTISSRVKSICS